MKSREDVPQNQCFAHFQVSTRLGSQALNTDYHWDRDSDRDRIYRTVYLFYKAIVVVFTVYTKNQIF